MNEVGEQPKTGIVGPVVRSVRNADDPAAASAALSGPLDAAVKADGAASATEA